MTDLCVPVTRSTAISELRNIVKRFIREKLTFGIEEMACRKYRIWRAALPGDLPQARNNSHDHTNRIIRKPVPENKVRYKWINGELVQYEKRGVVSKYFEGN